MQDQRPSAPCPPPPHSAPLKLRSLSTSDAQASWRASQPPVLLPPLKSTPAAAAAADWLGSPGLFWLRLALQGALQACHDCQRRQCSSTTLTTALQATPSSCAPKPYTAAAPQHLSLRPCFHVTLQARPGYNTCTTGHWRGSGAIPYAWIIIQPVQEQAGADLHATVNTGLRHQSALVCSPCTLQSLFSTLGGPAGAATHQLRFRITGVWAQDTP